MFLKRTVVSTHFYIGIFFLLESDFLLCLPLGKIIEVNVIKKPERKSYQKLHHVSNWTWPMKGHSKFPLPWGTWEENWSLYWNLAAPQQNHIALRTADAVGGVCYLEVMCSRSAAKRNFQTCFQYHACLWRFCSSFTQRNLDFFCWIDKWCTLHFVCIVQSTDLRS